MKQSRSATTLSELQDLKDFLEAQLARVRQANPDAVSAFTQQLGDLHKELSSGLRLLQLLEPGSAEEEAMAEEDSHPKGEFVVDCEQELDFLGERRTIAKPISDGLCLKGMSRR